MFSRSSRLTDLRANFSNGPQSPAGPEPLRLPLPPPRPPRLPCPPPRLKWTKELSAFVTFTPVRPAVKCYHSNTDLTLQNWRHVHTVKISLPFACVHNVECGSVHVQTHRAWTLSDRRGAETEDQEPERPAAYISIKH